jgi:dipeptidyl aminopeptidase/acylaminoacyl peptidase
MVGVIWIMESRNGDCGAEQHQPRQSPRMRTFLFLSSPPDGDARHTGDLSGHVQAVRRRQDGLRSTLLGGVGRAGALLSGDFAVKPIGRTTFSVKAVTAGAAPYPLPALTLTRGARHLAFLPGGRALVLLRGEIQHKNLWLIDLETGAERQLTNLTPEFDIRDFDISPDGREVVIERVQERSNVVLLDLPRP